MTYELFIARRYLRSKQNAGFLSFIAFIAVGGVILGVAALVIMLSVTNGFSGEVKSRLIGMDAHVAVKKWHGESIEAYRDVIARLEADPQFTGSAPVVKGKMVLWAEHEQDGALIWGIEPETFGTVSDLPAHLYHATDKQISFDPPEGGRLPGIVLGMQLANRLRIAPGQEVYLLTFPSSDVEEVALMGLKPKVHPFVVTDLVRERHVPL